MKRFPTGEQIRGFFARYGVPAARLAIRDARDVRPNPVCVTETGRAIYAPVPEFAAFTAKP